MKKKLLTLLLTIAVILTSTITVFADGSSFIITNGTPGSAKDTNHGYITIDKASTAEGDTVTIEAYPAKGYQLKSLTATPVAPTISTIADVLATVEGFPKDIIENSSPTAPSDAWTNGTGSAFTYKNLSLILMGNKYMYAQLTTGVTFDATNKCYTATVSTLGTLKFNMTDGVLTSFKYTHNKDKSEDYDGTYAPASTPSAKLKPITPAKQTDGTYQFTMPAANVTVTAEFEGKAITIADILPDDFPTCVDVLPPNLWVNGNEVNMMVIPYSLVIFTLDGDGNPNYKELANDIRTATLTKNGNNYTYTNNGITTTFLMNDNGLESVKIEGLTGEYVDFNGTYGEQHTHAPILVNGQAATESAAGWKDYYECACGALFEDENGTTPIENLATWKAEGGDGYIAPLTPSIDYEIISGNNANINIDNNKDVLFTSDADYSKFERVEVDSVTVDPSNYTVESGSTKVTLKASYLNTLSVGQHTIDIISTDGHASTTFTITKNSPSSNPGYVVPNTGVEGAYSNNHSLLKLSSLSLLAIGTYIVIKKKKDND